MKKFKKSSKEDRLGYLLSLFGNANTDSTTYSSGIVIEKWFKPPAPGALKHFGPKGNNYHKDVMTDYQDDIICDEDDCKKCKNCKHKYLCDVGNFESRIGDILTNYKLSIIHELVHWLGAFASVNSGKGTSFGGLDSKVSKSRLEKEFGFSDLLKQFGIEFVQGANKWNNGGPIKGGSNALVGDTGSSGWDFDKNSYPNPKEHGKVGGDSFWRAVEEKIYKSASTAFK